jgi:large subunit ribosomal protein L23
MSILKKPILTEKSSKSIANNIYTFEVDSSVNKIQVKNEIQTRYSVSVESVNILNRLGKKTRRGLIKGQRSDRKLAYVKLKDGQSIDLIKGLF